MTVTVVGTITRNTGTMTVQVPEWMTPGRNDWEASCAATKNVLRS
ncbi:MAG TPA: hypothetical protein VGR21_05835 [Cryptosporangiaceae bacterium]|nr:hypothetical protein [Cryptosporangiaceae bacterium]